MTRVFASDFDGTLYFHGEAEPVRAHDLRAVRAFQASGGLFGACTGRPVRALTVQSAPLVPFDFYVALSGATLHDADVRPIVEAALPREVARRMFKQVAKLGLRRTALVCAADDYWAVGAPMDEFPVGHVASFDELPDPVQGMGVDVVTPEAAARLAQEVNREYEGVASCYANLASIDVVPYGHSKGTGLRRAAEHFGATLTGGIGDGLNDLPLLEAADVSYTFPWADEAVRNAADVLVGSVAEALADFAAR